MIHILRFSSTAAYAILLWLLRDHLKLVSHSSTWHRRSVECFGLNPPPAGEGITPDPGSTNLDLWHSRSAPAKPYPRSTSLPSPPLVWPGHRYLAPRAVVRVQGLGGDIRAACCAAVAAERRPGAAARVVPPRNVIIGSLRTFPSKFPPTAPPVPPPRSIKRYWRG